MERQSSALNPLQKEILPMAFKTCAKEDSRRFRWSLVLLEIDIVFQIFSPRLYAGGNFYNFASNVHRTIYT